MELEDLREQIDKIDDEITSLFKKRLEIVKEVGEKKKQTSAISVYIANCGEELWDLSKRLSVSPEVLSANNKDLEFPLSGKERIVIYRQL
jgi:chorismate mutase